jgi:hypothetical protein
MEEQINGPDFRPFSMHGFMLAFDLFLHMKPVTVCPCQNKQGSAVFHYCSWISAV